VLLVAVPLVFDASVWPAFALPKFTVLAVGAGLLVSLALVPNERRHGRRRDGLELPVLALLAWTAASAVASPNPRTSILGGRETLNGLAASAIFAAIFFAAAGAFDRSHVRSALSLLWFGAAFPVLLYGAVQVTGLDPIAWRSSGVAPIWSTLGNPADLGGFLAIMLPVGLVLLHLACTPAVRTATAAVIALLLVELAMTSSRGALLAAAMAVVSLALWNGRRIGVLAAATLGVAALTAALVIGGGHTQRQTGDLARTGEGTTVALRVELWRTAWRMAEANPVLGVGPDGFARAFDSFRSERFVDDYGPELLATDAHNVFLTHLATLGLPGFAALLALLGSAAVALGQALRRASGEERLLLAAICAALVAYVVQASFNRQDLALDFCFWALLGLGCALRSAGRPAEEGSQRDDHSHGADAEGDPGDRTRSAVPVV
jgi:O-antigen ligase